MQCGNRFGFAEFCAFSSLLAEKVRGVWQMLRGSMPISISMFISPRRRAYRFSIQYY
jgi:hypothetical protein